MVHCRDSQIVEQCRRAVSNALLRSKVPLLDEPMAVDDISKISGSDAISENGLEAADSQFLQSFRYIRIFNFAILLPGDKFSIRNSLAALPVASSLRGLVSLVSIVTFFRCSSIRKDYLFL